MKTSKRPLQYLAALLLVVGLSGCANSPNDPLEGYNRQVYYFNDMLDTVVVTPATHAYRDLTPEPVQTTFSNFFGNISDLWTAFNNFLQGRGEEGFSDVSRILVNTFVGLGGLIDIASDLGLPKHSNDLGRTFGVWGAPPGPYFVLPLVGPSTVRDTIAAPADYWYGDPLYYSRSDAVVWTSLILGGVVKRSKLLEAASLIDDAAIDRYEFIREAWMQRRQHLIDSRIPNDEWETVETTETVETAETVETVDASR